MTVRGYIVYRVGSMSTENIIKVINESRAAKYVKRGQLFINHLAATDPTTSQWDTFYKPSNSANKRIVWL